MKKTLVFTFLFCTILINSQVLKQPINIDPKDRIAFTVYTVHEKTVKMTAQFYPLKNFEPFEASIQIFERDKWVTKQKTAIVYPGYTAHFRLENWDDSQKSKYRVVHNNKAFYEGIIQKNPIDKDNFTMVALTCNSIYPNHGGNISKQDIVDNIKKIQPDLLFFSGDQVYDHSQHYLYWLQFGKDFGAVLRNIPSIIIPDDHDVGQANIWGNGGIKSEDRRGIMGGYYMPVEYIKEVERVQTSHLPDPYDATPIKRGIGVYYTDLKWGGLSFAILEDRKFKSGPGRIFKYKGKITDAIFDKDVDTKQFDDPNAKLLGDRQLKFLEDWTTDWENAEMKSVLSQTIFAMANNYTGKHDREIIADFDTNGWPQTGRNKALAVIRKSFSPMIAGDQHLGTLIKHGIDDWNDAGYSFCTPAIANYWLRWWDPKEPGKNKLKNMPKYTGDFLDGFQNKITVHAVGNPSTKEIQEGGKLSTRVAGFGIVKYNKPNRTITFECWGRNIDITNPNSKQYKGWPVTISQFDNFNPLNYFELPKLVFSKPNQVVSVYDNLDKLVSSVRISGYNYQPKVLKEGNYQIKIGEKGAIKKQISVVALKNNTKSIKIGF